MSDTDQELAQDERLVYRTRLHWIVTLNACVLAAVLFVVGLLFTLQPASFLAWVGHRRGAGSFPADPSFKFVAIGVLLLVLALAAVAVGQWRRSATELAVTTRRVIVKTGIASRRTLEILLPKVESIEVDQSVLGRMLGFGTVIVRGTGGTPEPLVMVNDPLRFRHEVQDEIDRFQTQRVG